MAELAGLQTFCEISYKTFYLGTCHLVISLNPKCEGIPLQAVLKRTGV